MFSYFYLFFLYAPEISTPCMSQHTLVKYVPNVDGGMHDVAVDADVFALSFAMHTLLGILRSSVGTKQVLCEKPRLWDRTPLLTRTT